MQEKLRDINTQTLWHGALPLPGSLFGFETGEVYIDPISNGLQTWVFSDQERRTPIIRYALLTEAQVNQIYDIYASTAEVWPPEPIQIKGMLSL